MPELVLNAFESTVTMTTAGGLTTAAVPVVSTDAVAVFTVDVDDMKAVFKFQTDSADVLNVDASDLKYYVHLANWPVLNAANAMMDHNSSVSPIASGLAADKMMVAHDYTRYLAQELFGTYHGVDLFNNEVELLQNLRVLGGSGAGNTMGDILSVLTAVSSSTGDHAGIVSDASGNYMTNANAVDTNIGKVLFEQLANLDSSRFAALNNSSAEQSIPFEADDVISFKVTINPETNQHTLTNLANPIAARSYKVKLIMKASASVVNTAVDAAEL
jgi:hypothetical protein